MIKASIILIGRFMLIALLVMSLVVYHGHRGIDDIKAIQDLIWALIFMQLVLRSWED